MAYNSYPHYSLNSQGYLRKNIEDYRDNLID
jgi:hypothetical protein